MIGLVRDDNGRKAMLIFEVFAVLAWCHAPVCCSDDGSFCFMKEIIGVCGAAAVLAVASTTLTVLLG